MSIHLPSAPAQHICTVKYGMFGSHVIIDIIPGVAMVSMVILM